jgi:hypothetical protein
MSDATETTSTSSATNTTTGPSGVTATSDAVLTLSSIYSLTSTTIKDMPGTILAFPVMGYNIDPIPSASGLSTAAKAGIGAGVSLAALIFFAIIGFAVFKRRGMKKVSVAQSVDPMAKEDTAPWKQPSVATELKGDGAYHQPGGRTSHQTGARHEAAEVGTQGESTPLRAAATYEMGNAQHEEIYELGSVPRAPFERPQ